ncbi:subclass B1 metallo-beta-lactamase (plasmid) [Hymenobacter tibetensis]|uniref:beta-lactamase n=2 Tax=Hymenobacter tibetensis TaxID=497967 RepID=A0ABY4D4P6_9BACT|nr:subclass B1 metallo-beta-lactamase [Hymenobacter tibetensis]UOG77496.1 subclass B1 metallo-beta-lactamase [Hymenobacter tibetensis]
MFLVLGCRSAQLPKDITVYQSKVLTIKQVSPHVYQHVSLLQTNTFGRVECNGIVVVDEGEAIVFDTPANDSSSVELLAFTETQLKAKVKVVVPTHFHADCLGSLAVFHTKGIPSVAHNPTIQLAAANKVTLPQQGFTDRLELKVGRKKVVAHFLGEGHTKDNIVAYFPEEQVLFGGCLIKEMGASKGNLEDANVQAWPQTVTKLKQTYPKTKVLIPGHGQAGGMELSDYTIQLFK